MFSTMCSASSGSVQMCGLPSPWSWSAWSSAASLVVVRGIIVPSCAVVGGVVVVVVAGAVQLDALLASMSTPSKPDALDRVVEPALEPAAVDDEGVGVRQREQLRRRRVEAVRALRRRRAAG